MRAAAMVRFGNHLSKETIVADLSKLPHREPAAPDPAQPTPPQTLPDPEVADGDASRVKGGVKKTMSTQ